jgi:molybdopterin molybdotransferase
MLELEEAVTRILSCVPAPERQTISLAEAHRRVLLEPVSAAIDLPPFDNSAMDGYALRALDTAKADPARPARLRLAGRIAAGQPAVEEVQAGDCVRLFTGSPLPKGADAVVMQEDTLPDPTDPQAVHVLEPVRAWENVRLRGEDVRQGTLLASAGQMLSAGQLSLIAASGVARVVTGRQPKVGLIATGSELQEPGQPLLPGQIYESNRVGLSPLLRHCGAEPLLLPLVPDNLEHTRQALTRAFQSCAIVVTSGGASVGDLDLVRPAFEALGGKLEFWRIAIRPGRPFMFGRWDNRLLFGLPGNPISAFVTFLLLVRPALLRWQGASDVELRTFRGTLLETMSNPGSRRHFLRIILNSDGTVSSAGAQGSHVLSSFSAANGLLDVLPHTTLAAGQPVSVKIWDA